MNERNLSHEVGRRRIILPQSAPLTINQMVEGIELPKLRPGGGGKSESLEIFAQRLKAIVRARRVEIRMGEHNRSQCQVAVGIASDDDCEVLKCEVSPCDAGELLAAQKKAETAIATRETEKPVILPFGSSWVVTLDDASPIGGVCVVQMSEQSDFERLAELVTPEGRSYFSQALLLSYAHYSRSERLGEFAHDVKHYVMIGEELLRTAVRSEGETLKRALAKLGTNLKRVLLETNTVLLADKSDSGTLVYSPLPIQIGEIVYEVLSEEKILFESAQISVFSDLSAEVPESAIDPALFPTVIQNLFDNAIKYSDPGGPVQIQVLATEVGVQLEISNPAEPLSEQDREALFERYYRGGNSVHKPGSGLGLYLVRRIVELHGGQIKFTQEGRTSTFTVTLPHVVP